MNLNRSFRKHINSVAEAMNPSLSVACKKLTVFIRMVAHAASGSSCYIWQEITSTASWTPGSIPEASQKRLGWVSVKDQSPTLT